MAETPNSIPVSLDAGEARAVLAHAAGETAAALLSLARVAYLWQSAGGLTRLALISRAPDLAAALDAVPWAGNDNRTAVAQLRCRNCDHVATVHSEGGCWFSLTEGRMDKDLGCQCTVERVGPVTGQAPDDLWLIGWALHRAGGCIADHGPDARLSDDDEHAARAIAHELTRAGRLAAPALDPTGDAARALHLAEIRLRTMAVHLEAKGSTHRGTAAGVRLAAVKITELADKIGPEGAGPHTLAALDTADAVWRSEIAVMLDWLAKARRHYNQHAPADVADTINTECSVVDRVAEVIRGNRGPLYGWLPSHLWDDTMVQGLTGLPPAGDPA